MKNNIHTFKPSPDVKRIKRTKPKVVYSSTDSDDYNDGSIGGIFVWIVFVLALICVARALTSDVPFTFNSLLEFASNAPGITLDFSLVADVGIVGDWGVFEFLRNFFNLILDGLAVLVSLGRLIIDTLRYFTYFVMGLF